MGCLKLDIPERSFLAPTCRAYEFRVLRSSLMNGRFRMQA